MKNIIAIIAILGISALTGCATKKTVEKTDCKTVCKTVCK